MGKSRVNLSTSLLFMLGVLSAHRVEGGMPTPGNGGGGTAPAPSPSVPNPGTADMEAEVILRFNEVRRQYQAPLFGIMEPALTASAQQCANTLITRMAEAAPDDTPTNEALCNFQVKALQYYGLGPANELEELQVARSVVNVWTTTEERAFRLTAGTLPVYSKVYKHFTQVVWKSTTAVGCAVSKYYKTIGGDQHKMFFCYFNPAGNVQYGESNIDFIDNIGERIAVSAVNEDNSE